MSIVLTVTSAFDDYPRGAQITDATKVAEILDSEQYEKVVKSELPEPPPHVSEVAPVAEHEENPAA